MLPARPHRFDRLLCRIWFPCRVGQMRARRKGEAETHLKRPICCPPYLLQVGKKLSAIAKVVWLFEVRTYYTIVMSAARLFGERRALLAWSAGVALRAHQTQALVIQWRGRWRNVLAVRGKSAATRRKVFLPCGREPAMWPAGSPDAKA